MFPKHFARSKTLWFNFLTLLLLILSSTEFAQVFPDSGKYIALLNLVGNTVLRVCFTDQPLTRRKHG